MSTLSASLIVDAPTNIVASQLARLRHARTVVQHRLDAITDAANRINITTRTQRKHEDAFREAFSRCRDKTPTKADGRQLLAIWRRQKKTLYGRDLVRPQKSTPLMG